MNSLSRANGIKKIAVIIVNYNGGRCLLAALNSLTRQSIRPNEIVIVDNASEDDSGLIAQRKYPECTFHFLGSNTGFAAANNYAISRLVGFEYIALLNPDAIPDENWLASLLAAAEVLPEYGSFASRMLCDHDSSVMDGAGDVYHISGLPWRRFYQGDAKCLGLKDEEVFSACAGAALYKVSALKAAGLFDEDYFCYVEDVDLGFRLQLLGYRCRYVPSAVVAHVGSAITGLNSDFSLYYGHRNLVWTYIKNMPGVLLWLLLPLHLLLNVASIIYFVYKGRSKVICRAKWDAIRGLRSVCKKRQVVQRSRSAELIAVWRLLGKRLKAR